MSRQDKTVKQTADSLVIDQAAQPYLLGILEAIEKDSSVSQRKLAAHLGIALGLVNMYLRWCVQKGWVKIQHIPARRYAYYVTPQGFIEKSTFVGEHIQQSFALFRHAREECQEILSDFHKKAIRHVTLVGGGDLQEFAYMIGKDSGIEFKKVKSMNDITSCDAILLTDMNNSQLTYNALINKFPREMVYVLPLLRVSKGGMI